MTAATRNRLFPGRRRVPPGAVGVLTDCCARLAPWHEPVSPYPGPRRPIPFTEAAPRMRNGLRWHWKGRYRAERGEAAVDVEDEDAHKAEDDLLDGVGV